MVLAKPLAFSGPQLFPLEDGMRIPAPAAGKAWQRRVQLTLERGLDSSVGEGPEPSCGA